MKEKDIPKNLKILIWLIFASIVILVILFKSEEKSQRVNHPAYTIGTITGKSEGSKGEQYVDYTYTVNNVSYKGNVSISFCLECKDHCCKSGQKVKVRYAQGNPSNSDLIH